MNGLPPMRAWAQKVDYGNRVEIALAYHNYDDTLTVAQPVVFKREEAEGQYNPPTLSLRMAEAQTLIDALWAAGLRPSKAEDATGELRATKAHLEDFRELVFKRLTTAPAP